MKWCLASASSLVIENLIGHKRAQSNAKAALYFIVDSISLGANPNAQRQMIMGRI